MAKNKTNHQKPHGKKKDPLQSKKDMITICIVGFGVVMGLFLGMFLATNVATQKGNKQISLSIEYGEESKKLDIATSAQYLGDALEGAKLIEGDKSSMGIFVKTVDGHTADESKQEWWCFTKDGQELTTGVSQTVIADGDKYEITLKTGW